MNAIDFVVRTRTGAVERGSLGGEGQGFLLDASGDKDISLNLNQTDLRGYDRAANDLLITLADGRVLVLENYFSNEGTGAAESRVFLSANGNLNQVSFIEADGGALFAQYGPTETWGKWSPSKALIFVDDPQVVAQMAGNYGDDDEVSMLGTALLGLGGAGGAGLGTLLGLPLLFGGGGGGDGDGAGDPPPWTAPTVDDPDAVHSVSAQDDPSLTVTGTANPGSEVVVTIGGETVTVTAGDDSTWSATFTGDDFPEDGDYPNVNVDVTDPNGTQTTLNGPSFTIDTTPPPIAATDGTVSVGHVVNAEDQADGVTIAGTGETGATVTLTIDGTSQTGVVGDDGTWSFTFDDTVFGTGEYTTEITLTSVDAMGNTTTVTDSVQVDTVNTVSLDNAPLTGDNLISTTEHAAGVTLSGSSQAGSVVVVDIDGVTQTATAGDDGTWSVTFAATDLPTGTYTATAVITSTDAAGNAVSMSHSFDVDTEAVVTIDTASIAGDGVINGAEATSSVTVTGTGEVGSAITVTAGLVTLGTTVVAADGTWSLDFDPALLPGGPGHSELGYTSTLTVTATDAAGNTATASGDVTVDMNTEAYAGFEDSDGVINAVERADGVELTGGAAARAAITVVVGGTTLTTTADDTGAWSVTIAAVDVPEGLGTLSATVTSTDPAGNSTTVTPTIAVDTETAVTVDTGSVEGDGTINITEAQDGFTLSGNAEAGATVTGTVTAASGGGAVPFSAVADAAGNWSVDLPASAVPGGVETTLDVVVTATDAAGNTATTSGAVQVDTLTSVSIDTASVEGDGTINATERADGVTLTGTAQAGATVLVTMGSAQTTVVADASGAWAADFAAAEVPSGTQDVAVSATATDAAGNVEMATGTVAVDTETAVTAGFVDGDGTLNAVERADGVDLSGTAEAGAAISVDVGGTTLTTTADAAGAWSVMVPAGTVPMGTTTLDADVLATDAAGNTARTVASVNVDTEVGVTVDTATVERDGVINAVERADGVVLTGAIDGADMGTTIEVTLNGITYPAAITAMIGQQGTWEVTLPSSEIATGETTQSLSVTATDSAGNSATVAGTMQIDTVTNVAVITDTVETDGIINAAERADGVTLTGTTEPGAIVMVTLGAVTHAATVAADGSWTADFAAAEIPSGERSLPVTAMATDAAGNQETVSSTVDLDTFVRNFALTSTPGGADGVLNADEAAAGLVLTGTTEPGGAVTLDLDGQTVVASVAADGSWTATFTAAQLPSGEQTVLLTAISTDRAGNTETLTETVVVDTEAGMLTISPDPMEGDDVVNLREASDGVIITGTSTPGQLVDVTMEGVTHTVLTDATGTWVAPFAASEVVLGTYTAQISATITDSAGNVLTRTDSVEVDTEVVNFAPSGTPVETDNIINADEASDGFTLTGTTEPGGFLGVIFEGVAREAVVDPAGNWSVSFTAAEIPSGEMATTAVIQTADRAGNTAETFVNFGIDTLVNTLALDTPVAGDGVINAAEAAAGVTLTGDVEPGSTVTVTIGGMQLAATVDALGNWSVDVPSAALPTGTLQAPMVIEATDAAGNTRALSETLSIDTEAPDTLSWTGYGRDGAGVDLIRTEVTRDALYLGQLTDAGGTPTITDVAIDNVTDIPAINQSYLDLNGSVPDGTHLVLASTDAAGNTSAAYLVTDDPNTNDVQMSDDIAAALQTFNIDTIDLHFAEDSHLTITEEQIEALSTQTDTVAIRGGSDDSVTITGAQQQGRTMDSDGIGYNVYTLGDATLLIQDDITNVVV